MYMSKVQRMNTGPSQQLAKFGRTSLSVQWLYQLFLALECDVWIGTRNSNWNRLIDEMRCAPTACFETNCDRPSALPPTHDLDMYSLLTRAQYRDAMPNHPNPTPTTPAALQLPAVCVPITH